MLPGSADLCPAGLNFEPVKCKFENCQIHVIAQAVLIPKYASTYTFVCVATPYRTKNNKDLKFYTHKPHEHIHETLNSMIANLFYNYENIG